MKIEKVCEQERVAASKFGLTHWQSGTLTLSRGN
jgi:hypothetical protein